MTRRDLGAEWITSTSQLAAAYGIDESTMQQRVYALAEQIHAHYCFSRGPVNHSESRPDEHIAAAILGALVGVDWWMVKGSERLVPGAIVGQYLDYIQKVSDEGGEQRLSAEQRGFQQVYGVWVTDEDTEFTNQITGHHYRKVDGAWMRDDTPEG